MLPINIYPYRNITDLNLDFMQKVIRELEHEVRDFVSINAIKYADPIQWDITRSYEKNTVVIDGNSGVAYISVAPVPYGVALTRPEYWTVIFDLSMFITKGAANFANTYEVNPTVTATMDTNEGDWLVWDSTLYQALTDIHAGDTYTPDGNIKQMTVEDFYNILVGLLQAEAQTRADEDTRIELELTDLINSQIGIEAQTRADEDTRIEQELTDLVNSRVNAVMASVVTLDGKVGDLANLTTSDKSSIVNAINEVNGGIKYCNDRSEVSGVNANLGGYILSANAYTNDGIMSLYKVTNGVADGYLNIAMDNGNTAELVHGEVIHAHQVGAFPNGNDCVSAIDFIINNVDTVTIKFGKGKYTFTDRIWLNSNQSIEGENVSETILYIDRDPVGQHGEFIGIIGEHGTVKKNITLRDFSIDVYYLASPTEDVNPIGMVTAENILIERVNVLRSNWNGFQIEGETNGHLSNVIVRDCVINNVYKKGIGLSHATGGTIDNVLFENIVVNGADGGGMYIEGPYDGTTVHMSNVRVNGLYCHAGTSRAMYIVYADDVTVENVTVDDVSTSLYGVIQVQESHRIKFNNTTVKCSTSPHDNYAIFLYGGSDIVIDGLYTINAAVGVEVRSGTDNLTVSNSILNTHTGGVAIRNAVSTLHGYIVACIRNNAISNASTNFIELT